MEIAPGVEIIQTSFWGRPLNLTLFLGDRALLIDTGMPGMPADVIIPALNSRGLSARDLSQVLITHAHLDHFAGNEEIWEASGRQVSFAAHRLDVPWLEDPATETRKAYGHNVELGLMAAADLDGFIAASGKGVKIDRPLEGGEVFDLGQDLTLEAVFTPGHSLGNTCYLDRKHRLLVHGETVVGVAQFDVEGKLLSVPFYYDAATYLRTLATVARLDFDTLVSAHLSVMDRQAANQFLADSLDFVVRFDREVRGRLQEARPGSTLVEVWRSMDRMWGLYPADVGLYWLLETHTTGLIGQGMVTGTLAEGLTWVGPDRDYLAPLVEEARAAIAARAT